MNMTICSLECDTKFWFAINQNKNSTFNCGKMTSNDTCFDFPYENTSSIMTWLWFFCKIVSRVITALKLHFLIIEITIIAEKKTKFQFETLSQMYTSPNKSLELASLQRNLNSMTSHATKSGRVRKRRRKRPQKTVIKVRLRFFFFFFSSFFIISYFYNIFFHQVTKRRRTSSTKKRGKKRRKRRKS